MLGRARAFDESRTSMNLHADGRNLDSGIGGKSLGDRRQQCGPVGSCGAQPSVARPLAEIEFACGGQANGARRHGQRPHGEKAAPYVRVFNNRRHLTCGRAGRPALLAVVGVG